MKGTIMSAKTKKSRKMTQKEFWEILGKTKDWEMIGGIIRNANNVCPVCAVANYKCKRRRWECDDETAGQYLGLDNKFRTQVVGGADGSYEPEYQKMREKILKVCGLTE